VGLLFCLIAGGAGDAEGNDAVADGIELFVSGLEEACGGRLTIDGVDHDLLRTDIADGIEPRGDILFAGVIYTLNIEL